MNRPVERNLYTAASYSRNFGCNNYTSNTDLTPNLYNTGNNHSTILLYDYIAQISHSNYRVKLNINRRYSLCVAVKEEVIYSEEHLDFVAQRREMQLGHMLF